MRLEHYSVQKLKKQIRKIVGGYLPLESYHLFFFGSRVTGQGDEKSDIDIGIEGPKDVPPEAMSAIREELEQLAILYKIELVDFKRVSPDFRKIALKKIERI